jgi:hypothetical protein
MSYHNEIRTHLSLQKDAPISRAVELAGYILCRPILGGYTTNISGFDLRQAQYCWYFRRLLTFAADRRGAGFARHVAESVAGCQYRSTSSAPP